MIRIQRTLAMAAAGALMLSATAASAESTRPGASVPIVSEAVTDKMGTRSTKRVKADERFAGVPIFVLLIGGVAFAALVVSQVVNNDSRG